MICCGNMERKENSANGTMKDILIFFKTLRPITSFQKISMLFIIFDILWLFVYMFYFFIIM